MTKRQLLPHSWDAWDICERCSMTAGEFRKHPRPCISEAQVTERYRLERVKTELGRVLGRLRRN